MAFGARSLVRLAVWGILLFASGARAQDGESSEAVAPQASTIVLMLDPDPEPERDTMGAAVRAQLADLNVALTQDQMGADRDLRARMNLAGEIGRKNAALGVFWLERDPAVLYFMAPPFERLLSRGLGSPESEPSAVEEEVSIIVRSAVVALLQGEAVDMAPVELPPAKTKPATPPPAPRRRPVPPPTMKPQQDRLRVDAAYVGTSFSSSAPLQNGVGFGVVVLPLSSLLVGVHYTAALPIEVHAEDVAVRIDRHPVELSLGFELSRSSFRFQGEIAGLLDYMTRSTAAVSDGFRAQPDSDHLAFGVAARLRALLALFPSIYAFAGGGADFYGPRPAYVVESPTRREILIPRLAQPRLEAGFAVALW